MELKTPGNFSIIDPNLTDWEILSAVKYCRQLLERKGFYDREFRDMCFFIFDGNEKLTVQNIENVRDLYILEYLNRHKN